MMTSSDPKTPEELQDGIDVISGEHTDIEMDDDSCTGDEEEEAEGNPVYAFASEPVQEHLVEPLVRLVAQYDDRWHNKILHSSTTWRQSGCHPACIAMVLQWIAEDYAPTKGQFQFPTPRNQTVPANHLPRI